MLALALVRCVLVPASRFGGPQQLMIASFGLGDEHVLQVISVIPRSVGQLFF